MLKEAEYVAKQGQTSAKKLNGTMLGKLLVVALVMFGFGYALVPIYKQICELTGVNILTPKDISVKDISNSQIDLSREVTVEFDANTQGPWRFRPTAWPEFPPADTLAARRVL